MELLAAYRKNRNNPKLPVIANTCGQTIFIVCGERQHISTNVTKYAVNY